MAPPPAPAIPPIHFTNRFGEAFVVTFALSMARTYLARGPQGESHEQMVVARYLSDLPGFPDIFLPVVFAQRSVGVAGLLEKLARATVLYALRDYRPEESVPPPSLLGITWPYHILVGQRVLAHDYTGYRFRGAAGCVRAILPADYGTVSFWVEPSGVEPGEPS